MSRHGQSWTKEERDLLIKYIIVLEYSPKQLHDKGILTGRTENAIKNMEGKLRHELGETRASERYRKTQKKVEWLFSHKFEINDKVKYKGKKGTIEFIHPKNLFITVKWKNYSKTVDWMEYGKCEVE